MLRKVLIIIIGFTSFSLTAQTPKTIKLTSTAGALRTCTDQDAGTWTRGTFTGESNDTDDRIIYLCADDNLQLIGNLDFDLSGDPEPGTEPGIGYAFYDCPPTEAGPGLDAILNDPCLTVDPPPAGGLYTARGSSNGDILLENNGFLQNLFGGGQPVQLWFAPITIDDFADNAFEGTPPGTCTVVNTDADFSVVYLNALNVQNLNGQTPDALNGSFQIIGGLPEFDGSLYDNVRIELIDDPNITGTISNGPNFSHEDAVIFSVPQAGDYRITASDGKSCPLDFTFSMPRNTVEIAVSDPIDVAIGEPFCMEVSMANLIDSETFQFSVNWNPSILQFTGVNVVSPNPVPGFDANSIGTTNSETTGTLSVLWFANNPDNPANIIDETVIFEVCFIAIGEPGSTSYVDITGRPTEIEVISGDNIADVSVTNSTVTIVNPTNLTAFGRSCSTTTDDGSVSFTIYGGTEPYQYTLEGGGIPDRTGTVNSSGEVTVEDNLPPGTYTVTILDNAGGGTILTITVENTIRIFATPIIEQPVRCFEPPLNRTGRIRVDVGGGAEPYQYEWSNGIFGRNFISNLPVGNYSVTVTDANGCTDVVSTSLGVTPITIGFDDIQPTCTGISDGELTAQPSGGAGSFQYLWDNFNTNQTRTNLAPGCYTVTVEDALNCVAEATFCLEEIKTLELDIVETSPSCVGDTDGRIDVELQVSGGPANPVTFTWNPDDVGDRTDGDFTTSLSNLEPGLYIVEAVDTEGCNTSAEVQLRDPQPLRINLATSIAAECIEGGEGGSITLLASGGVAPRTFEWNDGEFTGNSLTDVPPGEYTVTVTDGNGCTADSVFFVGPWVTFEIVPESCTGTEDGAIFADVNFDEDFTVTIVWSNGETGNSITNLSAGDYTVTVTGTSPNIPEPCVLTFEVNIPFAERFTVIEDHTRPTCPGDNDGVINLIVEGDQGPFTFSWNHTTEMSPTLTNQVAGTYTVNINDQSGCPAMPYEITLEQPPFIMFSFSQIQGVSCSNTDCDGSAVLNLSQGSVPGGSFNVSWGDGNAEFGITTVTLTDLCFGDNPVFATDENGCNATSNVPVPGPEPIDIDFDNSEINDVSCFGDTDGNINLQAQGGTAPYQYEWPGLGVAGPSVSDLAPGLYDVIVTDDNDCTFETAVEVGEPDLLVLVIDTDNTFSVSCAGDNDGQITVIPVGGNEGPRIYQWSPSVSTTEVATDLSPGDYSISVTDSRGCMAEANAAIEEPTPIEAVIPSPDEPLCNGFETLITIESASGGSGSNYTFSVNNGPTVPVGSPFPTLAGEVFVSVFDDRGCSFDTTFFINEPPPLIVDLGPDLEMDLGDTISLFPFIQSDSPIADFDWMPGESLSCIDCEQPNAFPLNTTDYSLVVTDVNGCVGTDRVNVRVIKRRLVYIPNAFSPNNDGLNDVFEVYAGRAVTAINRMAIYDRWGNVMFEKDDLQFDEFGSEGWDGTSRGRDAQPGVYIYTIEVEFLDGAVLLYRGDITIRN